MPLRLNLRQIEAFKAVIDHGTVSRAAAMLHVSQPAMSQLIAHLELDTKLRLFDRVKGRLAPTEQAMHLYEEVGRIFSGVRQVEDAVEVIQRQEQGRLAVGVLPALANTFVQRAIADLLEEHPSVYCSVLPLGSQWIVDRLVARKLDAGLVGTGYDNPYATFEPLLEHPLVCVMPVGHELGSRELIEPMHLNDQPFIALTAETYVGLKVRTMLDEQSIRPRMVISTSTASMACEFVAGGQGLTLAHPLAVSGFEGRLIVRRFVPELMYSYQLCWNTAGRNNKFVGIFADKLRQEATRISEKLLPR